MCFFFFFRSSTGQALQKKNPSDIPPKMCIHPVSPKTPQTKQLFLLFRCAWLPVPSLIQSEEAEECPIYEFCSVQWHIVIRNHREQSPLRKYRGHSACLAMRQCNDTPVSPHRLGFIIRNGINRKRFHFFSLSLKNGHLQLLPLVQTLIKLDYFHR